MALAMTIEIRALTQEDDRTLFRSGDPALDAYFLCYAGQNQFKHHVGVTYVACEGDQICGFVTLSTCTLVGSSIPDRRRRPPYPLPALRIARLAVDERVRGVGLGKALLRFAIETAEWLRRQVGCVGLVVDAKPDAVSFYAKYGFVPFRAEQGESAVRPRLTPMFVALGSVPAPD